MARGNKSSGSSNPMQDHHKKARQKELQRNKQKRTKERDEKAIQTKTVREVKEEIQKVEKDIKRHHSGVGQQQQKSAADHKLARLRKELKLLEDAAVAAKARADTDAEAHRLANLYKQPQRPLTELDDPRKSVYYDPVLNPYGAPPPGKPRLYHRRFGGVTPNPHEAVVPGEEPQVPPPPPPPPPRYGQHRPSSDNYHSRGASGHRQHNNNQQQQQHPSQRPHPNRRPQPQQEGSSSNPPPPPQRQPLHMPRTNQSRSNGEGVKNNDDQNRGTREKPSSKPAVIGETVETTKIAPPASLNKSIDSKPSLPIVPSLPAPSQAVQRSMRVARNKKRGKGGLADIWASAEEVKYERITNLVDLEADDLGTAKVKNKKKKKKKKKPPLEFYYRDTAGTVQGPFSKAQMRGWMDGGFFPPTTKTRTNRMDPDGWVPMGDLPALKEAPEDGSSGATGNKNGGGVQDRIAALKGTGKNDDDEGIDASMQARIAAMRADLLGSMAPEAPKNGACNDDSVEDRIATLRGKPDSVEDRIAALRGIPDSVEDRIAALRGNPNNGDTNSSNNDDEGFDSSMQARIAAMRTDMMASSAPEAPNDDAGDDDTVQNRIAALRGNINNDDKDSNCDGNNDDEGTDPSMQARIAAMRSDMMTSLAPEVPNDDAGDDDTVQNRIAALRGDSNNCDRDSNYDGDNDDEGTNPSMQDRIAAMRADLAGPASAVIDQPQEKALPPINNESGNLSLQDRLAALRENAPPPPPPPAMGNPGLQDRIAALRKNAPAPPPPPAYLAENNTTYSLETGPSAYPMGDSDDAVGIADYPIDNENSAGVAAYPTSYPLGDEDQDGMAAYPVGDDNATDGEYDAVAPYPTDELYPGADDLTYGNGTMYELPPYETSGVAYPHPSEGVAGPIIPAPKKIVKVDKALVSFIPTNLQTKKRKTKEATGMSPKLSKKIKTSTKAVTAVVTNDDENYDEFMKGIDGL